MNDGADFLALYKELGVDPECDTDTFKRAYRRRVSGLHPDRAGSGDGDEEKLKKLNRACSAALEFHRVHGRFPGTAVKSTVAPAAVRHEVVPAIGEDAIDDADSPMRWRALLWLGLGVAVTALVLSASDDDHPASPTASAVSIPDVARPGARATEIAVLKLGMTPREVIAVTGQPFGSDASGQQWLYGASWVRVACGQLVDWYSSPSRPLNVAHERPGPDDTMPGFRPRRHCPPGG